MHITLFGGTFDPPHLGHSSIAKALLDKKLADEVWFLPVGSHAFDKKFSSALHRIAMLTLVLEDHQKIERYEIEQNGMSITYHTLNALAKKYPEHQFSFVIGSDNLARFHEWHHYEEMLQAFTFFVYPRQGFPLQPLHKGMKVIEGVEPIGISSTEVRSRIQKAQPVANLIKSTVGRYIQDHRLYNQEFEPPVS